MYEAELEYQPKFAALNKETQEQLYPELAGLSKELVAQAKAGMTEGLPDWARERYRDEVRGMLGQNVQSPIGADYASTGMLDLEHNWKNYYQNMGLSLSNKMPMTTPQSLTSGFTPQSVMGMNQGTYSPYASAYGNLYNTNASMSQFNQSKPFMYMQGAGNVMQGVGSMIPKAS